MIEDEFAEGNMAIGCNVYEGAGRVIPFLVAIFQHKPAPCTVEGEYANLGARGADEASDFFRC
jgi:hypothetical protein